MNKKILILFLLLTLTIGAVNASEIDNQSQVQINDGNTIISDSENTFEIDESNYNTYFDSSTGKITNESISGGSTLKLGSLTDKEFYIDRNVTITKINPDDELVNSMIALMKGSDGSTISGIKIINNENTRFTNVLLLNETNSSTITDCFVNSTNQIESNILINSSYGNTIKNSTFIIEQGSLNLVMDKNCNDKNNISQCNFETSIANSIIANDLIKIEKSPKKFEAKFLDVKTPLSNEKVTFKINGVEYRRTTDENGTARIDINLEAGNYTIESVNPKTMQTKSSAITVLPRIVENYDLEKFYRNASHYIVKILDDDGNPVANETVTFNINGVFYNHTTNASGLAKLNINLQPGEYIITAEHKGCKVSNNITVKPVLYADDLTKKYGTPDQFKVKLVDGQGNPLANETVTFNINGVFYERVTGDDGFAKLNIRLQPGEYIITSSYNEANIANKVTVTN